jgi:aminoglycoside phosphotransferase (APT) family kinase protein
MHAGELKIDESLVRRLVLAQFPQWAHLPIAAVPSAGTDNAIFRLGDEMAVRLPRIYWATGQAEKEYQWLPRLGPRLPLETPLPLALGHPGEGYPWRWSICRWLEGETVSIERLPDQVQAAMDLAGFVSALWRIDAQGGPPPDENNSRRGEPLIARDAETRAAIETLEGVIDTRAASAVWEASLAAPEWPRPPVWIHGDLQPGNLLARDGRISGVIDFGCLGVGDPSCDLMPAWNMLSGTARTAFRIALDVDESTWIRGRGWALSVGLIALPYYQSSNPTLAELSRRAINEALEDWRTGGK